MLVYYTFKLLNDFQLLLENSFLINIIKTGEMTLWLRALAARLEEGPGFDSQYPFANSEPSVTWVIGYHTTSPDLLEHQTPIVVHRPEYRQNIHTHKIQLKLNVNYSVA